MYVGSVRFYTEVSRVYMMERRKIRWEPSIGSNRVWELNAW